MLHIFHLKPYFSLGLAFLKHSTRNDKTKHFEENPLEPAGHFHVRAMVDLQKLLACRHLKDQTDLAQTPAFKKQLKAIAAFRFSKRLSMVINSCKVLKMLGGCYRNSKGPCKTLQGF